MMPSILFYCALGGLASRVSGAAVGKVTPTTPPQATSTLARRGNGIATLTLGDIGQYADFHPTHTVDKRSVAIFPTGIVTALPPEGLQVAFGPDLRKDIEKVVKEKCHQNKFAECHVEVMKVFQDSHLNDHAKRIIPLIAAASLGGILMTIIPAVALSVIVGGAIVGTEWFVENEVHMPQGLDFGRIKAGSALEQIGNIGDEVTAIALATGSDNKIMATVTVTPTPTPASQPSDFITVDQAEKDDGDVKKGDVTIKIPTTTSKKMEDFLSVAGLKDVKDVCKGSQLQRRSRLKAEKRALSDKCQAMMISVSQRLMGEVLGGSLNGLIPSNKNNIFNPAIHPEDALSPNFKLNDGGLMTEALYRNILRNKDLDAAETNKVLVASSVVASIMDEEIFGKPAPAVQNTRIVRVKVKQMSKTGSLTETEKCPKNLVCYQTKCKGYIPNPLAKVSMSQPKFLQTGICTVKPIDGCPCAFVAEPIVHFVPQNYFSDLRKLQQSIKGGGFESQCNPGDRIDVKKSYFEDMVKSACSTHSNLKRDDEKRDEGSQSWLYTNFTSNQWALDWSDSGGKCDDATCEKVFDSFTSNKDCSSNDRMSRWGSIKTKCGTATYTIDSPKPAECWGGDPPFAAPVDKVGTEGAGGGTSVTEAIDDYCNSNDGQKVIFSDKASDYERYKRYDASSMGVSKRFSFWMKAQYKNVPACNGEAIIRKPNCKAAFKQALSQCVPKDNHQTGGFLINGLGCIDYSLHVSEESADDKPPWRVRNPVGSPVCTNSPDAPGISSMDTDKAIAAYCSNKDGQKIDGVWDGKAFTSGYWTFPADGSHKAFHSQDDLNMRFRFGAAGTGIMNKDDCTYALKRTFKDCINPDKTRYAQFTYRGVLYQVLYVLEWNDWWVCTQQGKKCGDNPISEP